MLHFHTQPLSHSLFREYFTTTSGVYKRLGQFDYGQPNCTTDHIKTCIHKDEDEDEDGDDWIYIGEVKEGTDDTKHGIGIQVWSDGGIREGYWKDGILHGRGRRIDIDGSYYIGEWKNGSYNGEGTLYTEDGDKYIGIWDGWYKGQGEVNYEDGKKYIGQWDNYYDDYKCKYMRHGVGTLYSADGQVLNQGKWEKNEYKGNE